MKRGKRPELMWGFGLNETERAQIQEATGPGFFLRNYTPRALPRAGALKEGEKPSAAWIPWRVWNTIPEHSREGFRGLEDTQRILIQEESETPVELEAVLEEGFLTVVRSPLTRAKVQDALFRAKEVTSLYSDIYRMTEEIFLERELLARKTDQLLFLNKILTSATETLEPSALLLSARRDFRMLLPVRLLNAVFWMRDAENGKVSAEIFLSCRMDGPAETAWAEFMLESASRMGGKVDSYTVQHVCGPEGAISEAPAQGRVVALPLKAGNQYYGCLALQSDQPVSLGKDQIQTLHAAVNHLGLALRNALAFREIKLRADHDGLTRIHNRRSLDERLVQELKRHQRYRLPLSLLMLDVDHFKQVNDTHGHLAGDEVLRRIGAVLQESLRSTDFAARYGGEEFAVLLPHTPQKDARKLAERIRTRIAEADFESEQGAFRVTASIGVASLGVGSLQKEKELLLQADQALYTAKNNGRNMVVVSGGKSRARIVGE
ncbi:diguanylate cyclase [Desulfovibrio aminophilus]|uniref:GGDEF domain-containing protein n=1 Tax=Desulfovibrio aminophilus TaxID=81425 RepID=UPI003397880A